MKTLILPLEDDHYANLVSFALSVNLTPEEVLIHLSRRALVVGSHEFNSFFYGEHWEKAMEAEERERERPGLELI